MQATKEQPQAHAFEPIRRALFPHMTDAAYGASCEADARIMREALEQIANLFRAPMVDGKTVREITEAALRSTRAYPTETGRECYNGFTKS